MNIDVKIVMVVLSIAAIVAAGSLISPDSSGDVYDGTYEAGGVTYGLLTGDTNEAIVTGGDMSAADITIPATITADDGKTYYVTHIEAKAFRNYSSLKSVVIEKNDKLTIGASAFEKCRSLTSAVFGEGIQSTGNSIFSQCASLTQITLPSSLTTIDDKAFDSCTSLTQITLPSSLTTIGKSAFSHSSLKDINFEDCTALKEIGASGFAGTKITSLVLPDSVEAVYDWAFMNCSSLASVVLDENLKSIGTKAFDGCSFTSINIPSKVTDLHDGDGKSTFIGMWPADIKTITISDSNPNYRSENGAVYNSAGSIIFFDRSKTGVFSVSVNIEAYTFSYTSLDSIEVLDGAQYIGNFAFQYSGIKSVKIADSVTSLGEGAFASCKNLEKVILPAGITELPKSSFNACSALSDVTLPAGIVAMGVNAFSSCTSLATLSLPENLQTIGDGCFYNAGLTSISLPPSVTDIGKSAFSNTLIKEISVGDYSTVVKLNVEVFKGESFESITLNNVSADESAFGMISTDCPNAIVYTGPDFTLWNQCGPLAISNDGTILYSCLQSAVGKIVIPSSVTQIGYSKSSIPFNRCRSITDIAFEDADATVTMVSNSFFNTYAHASLVSVELPNIINKGSGNLFTNCDMLKSVTWTSIDVLKGKPFLNCPALEYLDLSDTKVTGALFGHAALQTVITNENTTITSDFSECSSLKEISIYGNVTKNMFKNCMSLEKVYLYNTESIGDYAFQNCASLSYIVMPETVSSIGKSSFDGCTSLNIAFPASLAKVGSSAFGTISLLDSDGTTAISASADNIKGCAFASDGEKLIKTHTVRCIAGGKAYLCASPLSGNFSVPAISVTGNSIEGWYTDAELSTAYAAGPVSSDLTIYAKTSAVMYTIDFDSNGGSAIESKTAAYGSEMLLPDAPVREGYIFAGWCSDSALLSILSSPITVPAGDMTLYAKWTPVSYTVAFNPNGGEGTMESQTMAYGTASALNPNVFTKDSSVFSGWNTAADGTGTLYANNSAVVNLASADGATVTLYAQWVESSQCVVIFDPAGGMLSGTQTLTLSSGSALVFTQTATRLGYTFSGWFDSEADGNKIENGAWVPQSAETTLYAHWTPNRYIVAFEPNGATGEPYTQEFVYGVAQNLVPCKFEKTGYLLATWNTEADGSGKDYGNIANVLNLTSESNGCITLYACGWNLQSYLFTVQNNGPVKSMYLEYGAEYSVTLIEKIGHTFGGWYSDAGFTVPVEATGTMPDHTLRMYPKWTPNTFTVKFISNGGSGHMADQAVTYGENTKLSANAFSKDGYSFGGWMFKDVVFADEAYILNLTSEADAELTFTAVWTVNSYTISFVSDDPVSGTTEMQRFTVEDEGYATAVLSLNGFQRAGYSFAGWSDGNRTYSDGSLISTIDLSKAVSEDGVLTIALTAVWTANSYTIFFDTNGGSAIDSIVADCGTAIAVPEPTKEGYTFAGWLKDGAAYSVPETMPAGDLTLRASWKLYIPAPVNGVISLNAETDGNLTLTDESIGTLKSYASSDSAFLRVSMGDSTFTFDSKAVAALNAGTLTIRAMENLDDETAALTKDAAVYAVGFGSNTYLNGGTVTVTVPYTLKDGQSADDVSIYRISDGSVAETIEAQYSDGTVTFATGNLSSLYAVGHIDTDSDDEDDSTAIMAVALAAVAVCLVAGIVYAYSRRV
ncbi:MAG: leucine-rich repeat protein [Candidatus Methanomethylophilus sp.]|jgi:uncharacterized repeat protein (TIGR02543 family)|nr:leucine-rich repeat protein [Methanomethylophilus sp.]MCI2075013.1 leucine-rich repeat protein [Methanomethylophilus sp.]MCI2092355.1 leucine-rich repeat protein [Methanomethylophilus sp.]